MPPEWDFGTGSDADEKRGDFIGWVEAELDYLATVTTDRFLDRGEPPENWFEIAKAMQAEKRDPWRPSLSEAERASDGMDAALADYIVIKHIFANHWPKRQRPIEDPASAERIAVRRNWHELREVNKASDWAGGERTARDARNDHEIEKAYSLQRAWRQWKQRPGRAMGEGDVSYLKLLRNQRN